MLSKWGVAPVGRLAEWHTQMDLARPVEVVAVGVVRPSPSEPVGDVHGRRDIDEVGELGRQSLAECLGDREVVQGVVMGGTKGSAEGSKVDSTFPFKDEIVARGRGSGCRVKTTPPGRPRLRTADRHRAARPSRDEPGPD